MYSIEYFMIKLKIKFPWIFIGNEKKRHEVEGTFESTLKEWNFLYLFQVCFLYLTHFWSRVTHWKWKYEIIEKLIFTKNQLPILLKVLLRLQSKNKRFSSTHLLCFLTKTNIFLRTISRVSFTHLPILQRGFTRPQKTENPGTFFLTHTTNHNKS